MISSMPNLRPSIPLFLVLAAACDSSPTTRPPPVVNEVELEAIVVAPSSGMIVKGSTLALSATGRYTDGKTEDFTTRVTWSSNPTGVVRVDPDGSALGVELGTAEVRATFEELSGTAAITVVASPLTRIELDPVALSLQAGSTEQLRAMGTFADGTSADVTAIVTWSSSDASVATVVAGLVTASSPGTAMISASDAASGVQAVSPTVVTVAAEQPTALVVTPSGLPLALGRVRQFEALARFAGGTEVDVTRDVEWTSSNPAIATVSNDPGSEGLATSLAEGITSISAIHPTGVRASVTLNVTRAELMNLVITPTVAVIASGQRQNFRAEGTYTDNTSRDLTNVVTWVSSDETVAVISNVAGSRGLATPVGTGTTTISAVDPASGLTTDDLGTSVPLVVEPPRLISIAVTPFEAEVPFGATQQFTATGIFSDNTSRNISTAVTWISSNTTVATVDGSGLASSLAQGTTTISAVDPGTGISSDASARSAELVVLPPALISISVTPSIWAMVVGSMQQFTATGSFSDGAQRNITSMVQWSSSGNAVTIDGSGLASAQSAGAVTIAARDPATGISSDASNGSSAVTVSVAQLVSISVTPTSTTVPRGADIQFVATGLYDNGATANLTDMVLWSSSQGAVAAISNAAGARGVATVSGNGTTQIAAQEPGSGISSNASGGSATISVAAGVSLVSIAVNPRTPTVDVNRTVQLSARGTFSGGARYPMTNAVTWSSSNASATVSNVEGSRGRVTGVSVGSAVIHAVHTPTGIGSAASGQSANLTIELGIVTLSQTWGGPTVTIDGTTDFGVNVGSVTFAPGAFPANAVITDVDVSINFLKTDGDCSAPAPGNPYHNETSFRIVGPTGTEVVLAPSGTWSGTTPIAPVTVVFDQSAAAPPSATPVSGAFQPNGGNLNTFNGTAPTGTWILQAGDNAGADPLCVNSYTVTITAQ